MKFLEIPMNGVLLLLNALVVAIFAIIMDLGFQVGHGIPISIDGNTVILAVLWFIIALVILKIYSIPKVGIWVVAALGLPALIILIFYPEFVW